MALTTQYSRISHHAITTAGATFHVPLGEDFTIIGGTLSWNVTGTELADREFGLNTTDNKAYLRIGSNINELLFVGGTANDQSFAETLAINNNSQTYNVIMGTSTYIRSANGGGQIELDYSGSGGDLYITSDNGSAGTPALFLSQNNGVILSDYTVGNAQIQVITNNGSLTLTNDGIALETNQSGITLIESGANSGQLRVSSSWFSVINDAIFIKDNLTTSVTASNTSKVATMIASQNSSFVSAINNSVILGGNNQRVSTSNTVSINHRQFLFASASNASAATTTLASISMTDGQTITITAIVNARCTSPDRNLGAKLTAVFLKYGGTIYQTSTTDAITKDGFGDGTTATIDTDGTNVRIRITNGAGLTTNWYSSYDYLLTY